MGQYTDLWQPGHPAATDRTSDTPGTPIRDADLPGIIERLCAPGTTRLGTVRRGGRVVHEYGVRPAEGRTVELPLRESPL